ncbi:hypothetical protein CYMTET_31095 [Cymbomonas tetramitiformis]|uniref:EGF-like domain-containing protein n=1 Tax=Cymbomonas tetramitiformis TaxID=36881 RepID=A0AAE0FHI2_9CHLO|nr:hypothetical protein CYMTET_31095 [Cymbomonas tetramitiformis]
MSGLIRGFVYVGASRRLLGNSAVKAEVIWSAEHLAGGADPDGFTVMIMNDPAAIFAGSSFLSGYDISAWGIYTDGSITISTPAMPSPPPPSPPPPPGCDTDPCFPGTHCTEHNVTFEFICHACPTGYLGDGIACDDVDECSSTGNHSCDVMTECVNTVGAHTCTPCPEGFEGSGLEGCLDVDECAADNGGCAANCTNVVGSRECGPCPEGSFGSGYTGCSDINECLSDNGGCDFSTDCIDTVGGRTCTACPSGYSGSGEEGCVDIDECQDGNNGGCSQDPLVTCSNQQPGVACGACPAGYRGSGFGADGCRPALTCAEGNGGCDPLTTCSDAAGGGTLCGDCPDGFSGSGSTQCSEVDGCLAAPCWPGVDCADVPAPGVGYICGDCPPGMIGNGMSCEEDKCVSGEACSALVTCATTPGGGYTCGTCPQGFIAPVGGAEGVGVNGCQDVDECATSRGGCDPLVSCVNVAGGYYCTACPDGYRGGGDRCLPMTACSTDNGGCDELTTCTDVSGGTQCGTCPAGYIGEGDTGCVDEPGCSEDGGECFEGVACQDVPPPGTGYFCGKCPVGYVGDGADCTLNACFNFHGGCDPRVDCTNDAAAPAGRRCGACPIGYSDTLLDGTQCDNTNGCSEQPCFPGVECTDVVAPGTGRTCAACPAGYQPSGDWCEDVDECAGEESVCWALSSAIKTTCINRVMSVEYPRGYDCSACPSGYKGSGTSGCSPSMTCDVNNGGCWVGSGELAGLSTSCTDSDYGPQCGACPEGYAGTGDEGCYDFDACAGLPCFPGVVCTDAKAPAQGHACDMCPEGYEGDGETCSMCSIRVTIVDSTVVDGKERRAGWYRGERMLIVGQLDGLSSPNCTNTQGITYRWAGARSDGSTLVLDAATNKANTMKLSIPKADLAVGMSYTFRLYTSMRGNTQVMNSAELQFYVESQPLVVAVSGGNVITGDRNAVTLNASNSIDPDGEEGDILFRWTCSRDDNTGSCRFANGTLVPTRLAGAAISVRLQGGAPEAVNYTFSVTGSKVERSTTVWTKITVMVGGPPVVAIAATLSKANPNEPLRLSSEISAVDPAAVTLEWTVEPAGNHSGLVLADAMASADPYQEDLVIAAHHLVAGGAYLFTLRATDLIGDGMAVVEVQVNTPPAGGHIVVDPLAGIALSTVFGLRALSWTDEDQPLWYSFSYLVLDSPGRTQVTLADFTPLPPPLYEFADVLSEPGVQAFGHTVQCIATVQDALGATASAGMNVTVEAPSEEQQAGLVDSVSGEAEAELLNGNHDAALIRIDGTTSLLNQNGSSTRRRLLEEGAPEEEELAARQQQRDNLLDMMSSCREEMFATATSVERLSVSASSLVAVPGEVGSAAQDSSLQLFGGLLSDSRSTAAPAPLSAAAATAICGGLSSLTQSVNGSDANATAGRAAEVLGLMESMAASLLQSAAPGEKPQEVLSATLAMAAQRSDASKQINPLSAPGSATAVAFPSSLGQALLAVECITNSSNATATNGTVCGAESSAAVGANSTLEATKRTPLQVDTKLITSKSDPFLGTVGASDTVASDVTTIELTGEDGGVLSVQGLQEGITFTLALEAGQGGGEAGFQGTMRCTFWDVEEERYSTEGCVALPNPAPAGAELYWKSLVVGEFPSGLGEMWGIGNLTLAAGCMEEYGALDPAYEGTDAGMRKYVTNATSGEEECALANAENAEGCWWEWKQQIFVGGACEQAAELSCLCTHLTDFKAQQEVEVESFEPPEVKTLQTDDMLNITAEDLLKSAMLLTIVGGIMGGAVYLATASLGADRESRQRMLEALVANYGSGANTFKKRRLQQGAKGGTSDAYVEVWTWSIFEEARQRGIVQMSQKLKRRQREHVREKVLSIDRVLQGAAAGAPGAGGLLGAVLSAEDALGDDDGSDKPTPVSNLPPIYTQSLYATNQLPAIDRMQLPSLDLSLGLDIPLSDVNDLNEAPMVMAGDSIEGDPGAAGERADDVAAGESAVKALEEDAQSRGRAVCEGASDATLAPWDAETSTLRSRHAELVAAGNTAVDRVAQRGDLLMMYAARGAVRSGAATRGLPPASGEAVLEGRRGGRGRRGGSRSRSPSPSRSRSPSPVRPGGTAGVTVKLGGGRGRERQRPDPQTESDLPDSMSVMKRMTTFADALADRNDAQVDELVRDSPISVKSGKGGSPSTGAVDDEVLGFLRDRKERPVSARLQPPPSSKSSRQQGGAQSGSNSPEALPQIEDEEPMEDLESQEEVDPEVLRLRRRLKLYSKKDQNSNASQPAQHAKQVCWNQTQPAEPEFRLAVPEPEEPAARSGDDADVRRMKSHLKAAGHLVAPTEEELAQERIRTEKAAHVAAIERARLDLEEAKQHKAELKEKHMRTEQAVVHAVLRARIAKTHGMKPLEDFPTERPSVDRAKRRRMGVRLVAFARMVSVLHQVQDLRVSERLCELLGLTLTAVNECLPIEQMRVMALERAFKESASKAMDTELHKAYLGASASMQKNGPELAAIRKVSQFDMPERPGPVTESAQKYEASQEAEEASASSQYKERDAKTAVRRKGTVRSWKAQHMKNVKATVTLSTAAGSHKGRAAEASDDPLQIVERVLGTAMVMAFLDSKSMVTRWQLRTQMDLMEQSQWEYPSPRTFRWYVNIFKVLINSQNGPGWYYRTILWNLIFLQRPDGSYEISPSLVGVLHVNPPSPDLGLSLEKDLSEELMRSSIPERLYEIYEGLEEDQQADQVEAIWATLCVIERYERLPFGWEVNPQSRPSERQSLSQLAEHYLSRQTAECPDLAEALPSIRKLASDRVEVWNSRHVDAIKALRADYMKNKAKAARDEYEELSFWERRSQQRARVQNFVRQAMSSHPWASIASTKCLAPVTRAQRILVECTSVLLLLVVTLWFYYSKAATCCIAMKRHLGCPEPITESSPCFDHAQCFEFMEDEQYDEQRASFECDAFPKETLFGRLWATVILLSISLPVNIFFKLIFHMGGMAGIPGHWTSGVSKKLLKVFRKEEAGKRQLENFFFLVFTLFLDPRLISRALARYLALGVRSLEFLLEKLAASGRSAGRRIRYYWEVVRFLWRFHVRGEDISKMVAEAEVKELLVVGRKEAQERAASTFERARSEMDNPYIQLCYFLIGLMWAMSVWVMIAYAVLIRMMLGSDAENAVLTQWITTVIIDNLGVQVVKAITIKLWIKALFAYLQDYAKDEAGVVGWYERYIAKNLNMKYTTALDDAVESEYDTLGVF